MKEEPEAIQFADDRPMSLDDDLYQWALDAESLIRALQSRLESLEKDAARYRWLKEYATDVEVNCLDGGLLHHMWWQSSCGEDLSKAIDTSMQANKGE